MLQNPMCTASPQADALVDVPLLFDPRLRNVRFLKVSPHSGSPIGHPDFGDM